jgi:hypothetical protein
MCGRIIITRIAIAKHPTPLFWYLGFHGNAILNLINMPKASTHHGEYSYDDQGISEKSSRQKCVEE